jgi:phage-related protein
MIVVLSACQRELQRFPEEIRGDLADALARLDIGQMLVMPLSRPMPVIGNGVHELRLKDRSGAYRVFYALPGAGVVHVLHAVRKKTRATPKSTLAVVRKRLKELQP